MPGIKFEYPKLRKNVSWHAIQHIQSSASELVHSFGWAILSRRPVSNVRFSNGAGGNEKVKWFYNEEFQRIWYPVVRAANKLSTCHARAVWFTIGLISRFYQTWLELSWPKILTDSNQTLTPSQPNQDLPVARVGQCRKAPWWAAFSMKAFTAFSSSDMKASDWTTDVRFFTAKLKQNSSRDWKKRTVNERQNKCRTYTIQIGTEEYLKFFC